MKSILLLLFLCVVTATHRMVRKSVVPVLSLDPKKRILAANKTSKADLKYLPFIMLVDKNRDTSEYWRETEILSLVRSNEEGVDYERCATSPTSGSVVQFASVRNVRPICRDSIDFQLCPQCAHFSNTSECELFRDSCKERRVRTSEYHNYCDNKYGKWRTLFIPSDYSQCRCCDVCVFYRELDQSCVHDEFDFDADEFLPVNTIDFRAGCNPYWGHPDQETLALRCDKNLRRCVPVTVPSLPKNTFSIRRSYRYEPPTDTDCPVSCRGYTCPSDMRHERECAAGAFVPDNAQCNCCGRCSAYFRYTCTTDMRHERDCPDGAFVSDKGQCNCNCCRAYFRDNRRRIILHSRESISCSANDARYGLQVLRKENQVEEEFLEPGCDDGLVCRQGSCQDIHSVQTSVQSRKRSAGTPVPYEPCKREMKMFKKKYGADGHMHYEAPQCTPLWLYAPVQCRRFLCYCAMEDGTMIEGIKVPRVEVSNMNCDCAREKCRMGTEVECDGFGNYRDAMFAPHIDEWSEPDYDNASADGNAKTPSAPETRER